MFEDLVGVKPKIVCKKCGSDDIEVSEKMLINKNHPWLEEEYKQLVRCYECGNTYYIYYDV